MTAALKRKNTELDLTSGSIFKKLFIYCIPFIFSNILQIAFNMADIAVLGNFVSDAAVAAVGANASLTTLLVALFIAFSVGANVVLAKYVGARDLNKSRKTRWFVFGACTDFGAYFNDGWRNFCP